MLCSPHVAFFVSSSTVSALAVLLTDLDRASASADEQRRALMLQRIADLYLGQAPKLNSDSIDLFDEILVRLTTEIERRARLDLARKLASVPHAPPRVMRQLAHDEIEIAKLVLERSLTLSEDDLISVAMTKGDDHRQILAGRPGISEPVTDALLERGGMPVARRLAANRTARISNAGFELLLTRSRTDDILQKLLAERKDLPLVHVHRLIDIAGHAARERLRRVMPDLDEQLADRAIGGQVQQAHALAGTATTRRDYTAALATVHPLVTARLLNEAAVKRFAMQERFEEMVCAISALTGLSLKVLESVFDEEDADRLLVIGRALGFSWSTMQTILTVGFVHGGQVRGHHTLMDAYERITQITAQRVVQYLNQHQTGAD